MDHWEQINENICIRGELEARMQVIVSFNFRLRRDNEAMGDNGEDDELIQFRTGLWGQIHRVSSTF